MLTWSTLYGSLMLLTILSTSSNTRFGISGPGAGRLICQVAILAIPEPILYLKKPPRLNHPEFSTVLKSESLDEASIVALIVVDDIPGHPYNSVTFYDHVGPVFLSFHLNHLQSKQGLEVIVRTF